MEKITEKIYSKNNHKLVFVFGFLCALIICLLLGMGMVIYYLMNPEKINLNGGATNTNAQTVNAVNQGLDISEIKLSPDDYYLGSKEANKILVFYADFTCTHSKQFYEILKAYVAENNAQVKLVWRNFPLSFYAEAEPAAIAAECAGAQGKFWEYAEALFTQQADIKSEVYLSIADNLKLDSDAFKACQHAAATAEKVQTQFDEGMAAGVSGTPNLIYLNTKLNTGEYVGGTVDAAYLTELIK